MMHLPTYEMPAEPSFANWVHAEEHHPSSGPDQSSSVYHLPRLPTFIPFLAGCKSMKYTIRSCLALVRNNFPELQRGGSITVHVNELRQLYDTTTNYWGFLCYVARDPIEHDKGYRQYMRLIEDLIGEGSVTRGEGSNCGVDSFIGGASRGVIEDTFRELVQEKAARRFTVDHHLSSGLDQSSSVYHLPRLPTAMHFLAGRMPKYTIRSCQTPEQYTLPELQSGGLVTVPVNELQQLYDTAANYFGFLCYIVSLRDPIEYDKGYHRHMRLIEGLVGEDSNRVAPSDSFIGSVQNVFAHVVPPPAPRRSLLGRTKDAGSAAKRGR